MDHSKSDNVYQTEGNLLNFQNAETAQEEEEALEDERKRSEELHKLLEGAFTDLTNDISCVSDDESLAVSPTVPNRTDPSNASNLLLQSIRKIDEQTEALKIHFRRDVNKSSNKYNKSLIETQQESEDEFLDFDVPHWSHQSGDGATMHASVEPNTELQHTTTSSKHDMTIRDMQLDSPHRNQTPSVKELSHHPITTPEDSSLKMSKHSTTKIDTSSAKPKAPYIIDPDYSDMDATASQDSFKTSFERSLRILGTYGFTSESIPITSYTKPAKAAETVQVIFPYAAHDDAGDVGETYISAKRGDESSLDDKSIYGDERVSEKSDSLLRKKRRRHTKVQQQKSIGAKVTYATPESCYLGNQDVTLSPKVPEHSITSQRQSENSYRYCDLERSRQMDTLYSVRVQEINHLREELARVKQLKDNLSKNHTRIMKLKNNEIERLHMSLKSTKQLVVEAQKKERCMKEQLDTTENKKSVAEIECNKAQRDLNIAQMKIIDLESRLIVSKEGKGERALAEIQNLRKMHNIEINKLRNMLDRKVSTIENLQSRLNEMSKNNDEIAMEKISTINRLMTDLEHAQKQIETVHRESSGNVQTVLTERDHLKERVQTLQSQIVTLSETVKELEISNKIHKANSTGDADHNVNVLENELIRALKALDQKRDEIKRLHTILTEQSDVICTLNKQQILSDVENISIQLETGSESDVIATFRNHAAKLQQRLEIIAPLRKAYEALNQQYADLTAAYVERSDKMQDLEDEITRLRQDLLKTPIDTCDATCQATLGDLSNEMEKKRLTCLNEGLLAEIYKLAEYNDVKEFEMQKLQQQLNTNCQSMAEKIGNLVQDFNRSRETYEIKIQEKIHEIVELQTKLQVNAEEITTLRDAIILLRHEKMTQQQPIDRSKNVEVKSRSTQIAKHLHCDIGIQTCLKFKEHEIEVASLTNAHAKEQAILKSTFKTLLEAELLKMKSQYSDKIVQLQSEKGQLQNDFVVLENHCKQMVECLQDDKNTMKNLLANYQTTLNELTERKSSEPFERERQLIDERDKLSEAFQKYTDKIGIVYLKYKRVKAEIKEAKEKERTYCSLARELQKEVEELKKVKSSSASRQRSMSAEPLFCIRKSDAQIQTVSSEYTSVAVQVCLSPDPMKKGRPSRKPTSSSPVAAASSSHATVKPQIVSMKPNIYGSLSWQASLRSRGPNARQRNLSTRPKRK